MENAKLGMLVVSIALNILLYSEIRKQAAASSLFMQQVSSRLDIANNSAKAAATPTAALKDKAIVDMVNSAVADEFRRYAPPAPTGMTPAEKSRIEGLQSRVDALQKRIDEKGNAGQDKEKRLREEAAKLKQEVLNICAKR